MEKSSQARHWFPIFRERCNNIAEQDMLRTLRSGKYSFLVHAIPTFESPRPTALSLGLLCGRSLNNFLLSSHLLEVETGRYIRQQREQRFCQACKRSLGLRVLGDEQHALSSCVRAAEQRQLSFAKILSLFPGDSLRHIQHNSLFNMLNSLNTLSTNQQKSGMDTSCEVKHPQWVGDARPHTEHMEGMYEKHIAEVSDQSCWEVFP